MDRTGINPEYPGDRVGRPADEREQAEKNFTLWPERSRRVEKTATVEGQARLFFPPGTTIWPADKGRGSLLKETPVRRLEGKIKRLTGWQTTGVTSYQPFGDSRLPVTLETGTMFGASPGNVRRKRK